MPHHILTVLAFAVPLAAFGWMALRDHRAALAARRPLLDPCAPLFDRYALTYGEDGFPRLSGRLGPHNIDVRLLSDTLTIRRLPQLWLQVTRLEPMPGLAGFAVLVRPSGYDFYSLTANFHHILEVPPGFPSEVIVRGESPNAQYSLNNLEQVLARILADPRVKEVAVTSAGLRIVRQASEGRRGEYLLLRQATFDDATVTREALQSVLADLEAMSQAAATPRLLRESA